MYEFFLFGKIYLYIELFSSAIRFNSLIVDPFVWMIY